MSLNFIDKIPYGYTHMFAIPHTEKHNYNVKKKFSNIFTSILARTILAHMAVWFNFTGSERQLVTLRVSHMVLKVTISPVVFTHFHPMHRIAKSHFHII